MPPATTLPLESPLSDLLATPAFAQATGITLRENFTILEALAHLRSVSTPSLPTNPDAPAPRALYFYVLDADARLVGVVSARQLLLSPAATPLSTLMNRKLITLRATNTLFDACELFALHRLLAIPILDASGKLLGILDVSFYTDQVFNLVARESADDIFQLMGLHLEQMKNASALKGFKLRMPWLLANVAGGLGCAVLGSFFEHILQQIIVLSLFIPIMLTLSESVAIQSMTLALQSATGHGFGRSVFREFTTSLLLGCCTGLLVALLALFWGGPAVVAVIGISIAANMLISAIWGNILPKLITVWGLNPTVASGPIVLACVDISSIVLYLSLATLALAHH